jgi:hypothetical protein
LGGYEGACFREREQCERLHSSIASIKLPAGGLDTRMTPCELQSSAVCFRIAFPDRGERESCQPTSSTCEHERKGAAIRPSEKTVLTECRVID